MSTIETKPVDLDSIAVAASALAERNDESDATKLAAERMTSIVNAASSAALTGIGKQMDALRQLSRQIERRREALIDAANEHARFCHDVCKSEEIMAEAIEALHKQFASGLPTTLRLVPSEGER